MTGVPINHLVDDEHQYQSGAPPRVSKMENNHLVILILYQHQEKNLESEVILFRFEY